MTVSFNPLKATGDLFKRLDRRYLPDDRKAWIKTKCLNRGEFVVAGWSDPEDTVLKGKRGEELYALPTRSSPTQGSTP